MAEGLGLEPRRAAARPLSKRVPYRFDDPSELKGAYADLPEYFVVDVRTPAVLINFNLANG